MSRWIGRTLSKVTIERPIAKGGMAEIYLGRHETLERPVAVKVLHAYLSEDSQLMARFETEAKAVAALQHPNIVRVYDFDFAEGQPYIVMELIEGPTLAQYLRSLHNMGLLLPLDAVGRQVSGLASALDYAHGRGIVHRDVKPSNVLLRAAGSRVRPGLPLGEDVQPVLTDFGLARITGGSYRTATGTVMGTPAYMSPEQVRGEHVDGRTDIYSLGTMLYEMLAGRPPFVSEEHTPVGVVFQQINQPVPPIANVSPGVQAVVNRALAKPPADRQATAGELADAFVQALPRADAEAITRLAVPSARPAAPGRFPGRRRWLMVGGGLAAIAVLSLGVFGLRAWLRDSAAPRPSNPAAVQQPSVPGSPTPAQVSTPARAVFPLLEAGSQAELAEDTLVLRLVGAPPAENGGAFSAWLIGDDGEALAIGTLAETPDGLTLRYVHPPGADSLTAFASGEIWLGPQAQGESPAGALAYQWSSDPEIRRELLRLADMTPDGTIQQALLLGAPMQAGHYDSHLGFAVEALGSGDLPGAKRHAEHLINIIEGAESELFGDWNDDGRSENPGDSFGLLPYLSVLRALTLAPALDLQASVDVRQSAAEAAARADSLSEVVGEALAFAQRIAAADTAAEAGPIGEALALRRLGDQVSNLAEQVLPLPLALRSEILPAGDG
jgi:tRNA A-37 threonylcarbamoyl transferase component Bud32